MVEGKDEAEEDVEEKDMEWNGDNNKSDGIGMYVLCQSQCHNANVLSCYVYATLKRNICISCRRGHNYFSIVHYKAFAIRAVFLQDLLN